MSHERSSGLSTRLVADLELIENINPGVVNYENLLYPYNNDYSDKSLNPVTIYNTLDQQIFDNSLLHIQVLYKILITTTLLKI